MEAAPQSARFAVAKPSTVLGLQVPRRSRPSGQSAVSSLIAGERSDSPPQARFTGASFLTKDENQQKEIQQLFETFKPIIARRPEALNELVEKVIAVKPEFGNSHFLHAIVHAFLLFRVTSELDITASDLPPSSNVAVLPQPWMKEPETLAAFAARKRMTVAQVEEAVDDWKAANGEVPRRKKSTKSGLGMAVPPALQARRHTREEFTLALLKNREEFEKAQSVVNARNYRKRNGATFSPEEEEIYLRNNRFLQQARPYHAKPKRARQTPAAKPRGPPPGRPTPPAPIASHPRVNKVN
jgi:hypothetical protein